jgi:hypothetical protein
MGIAAVRARRRLTEEYSELISGERCRRIQTIIATAAAGTLGTRDQRRMARHVSYCQPCRRQARLAGLDASVLVHTPVKAKIAAFLPLPAFLKRRLGGGGDSVSGVGSNHAPTIAQWSSAVSDPSTAGWVKAAATAATIAIAGAGAGAAVNHADAGRPPSGLRGIDSLRDRAPANASAKPAAAGQGATAALKTAKSGGGTRRSTKGRSKTTTSVSPVSGTSGGTSDSGGSVASVPSTSTPPTTAHP